MREALSIAQPLPCFRHPNAHREIALTGGVVGYEVRRSVRRSIALVVCEQGLTVRAPHGVAWPDIEAILIAKEKWILLKLAAQLEQARLKQSARIEWRDGGCVPFLGALLQFVLTPGLTRPEMMTVCHAELERCSPYRFVLRLGLPADASSEAIKDQVLGWMRQYAYDHFTDRIAHFSHGLQVNVSRLTLSSARTRWGSARSDGAVRLHWGLIHFRLDTIDYVVVHELAHLREMNHSPRFWALVKTVLPRYENERAHLRRMVLPY